MNGGCMMGMHGAMILFWILLLALVVWGIYHLLAARRPAASPNETPMETLQRRYAAGDLSTEAFEERKRRLSE